LTGYKTLVFTEDDGIVKITLNRPDKLNALNAEMYQELIKVISGLENSPTFRVLIITGAGRAFCAGAEIQELIEASKGIDAIQRRLRMSHGVASHLKRLRQPIITSINGDAAGGGCGLALHGDLRVASDKARLGLTFNRVGLALDLGSVYNLVHCVGINKACELAFLGDIIDAREAERIGLVNRVVPHEELDSLVQEWASKLARGPQLALRLVKSALYKALNLDFFSELENEINVQSLCLGSQDGKEGLRAFLEKRKPLFGKAENAGGLDE
jgi:enoyl-CoA hydratase/carnithine racemase